MGLFKKSSNESVVTKRAFSRRFVEEDTVERETYHGVLRSELDEPAKLPQAFEQLIEDLVEKSLGPCKQALSDAGLGALASSRWRRG